MKTLIRIASALLLLTAASMAAAQGYPNRPITLVVPYPPGGATDPIARIFSQKLSEAWGQPIVIDNRPGGGTTIGMAHVAKSAPDGYTIIMATTSVGTNPSLYTRLPYDTMRDFSFLSLAGVLQTVLIVNAQIPVKTVPELVAYAKANPGKLDYASAGNGTITHLAGELFKSSTGINVQHVPYKGSSAAVLATMTGEVAFTIDTFFTIAPQLKSGKVRPLAVAVTNRIESMPELPLLSDTYPGFSAPSWLAFMGPANLPPEIANKWTTEVARIARTPEVKEKLAALGVAAVGSTQPELVDFVQGEIAKWKKVVVDSHIEKLE